METFLSMQQSWQDILLQIEREFAAAGLDTFQSFDLQSARNSMLDPLLCPCPDHGTDLCDCQYLIVLIKEADLPPLSLEIHGHDGWTYLSLLQPSAGSEGGKDLIQRVREALVSALGQPIS